MEQSLEACKRKLDLFFGRDSEISTFVERLREEAVLPVVGPSGGGKSSFVSAGVIPRLRERGPWLVLRLRPGRHPFQTLASRLLGVQQGDDGRSGLPFAGPRLSLSCSEPASGGCRRVSAGASAQNPLSFESM